ncbi:unnamed protein product [Brachionus calyciflorus]|uniref:Uncharacterized protein n=1 Tax=Brachionus calyciflorus TaxID=104777 RepID=A0A814C3E1_9BILA|nr:unnamed protein product [Brachionus calyciflorus]
MPQNDNRDLVDMFSCKINELNSSINKCIETGLDKFSDKLAQCLTAFTEKIGSNCSSYQARSSQNISPSIDSGIYPNFYQNGSDDDDQNQQYSTQLSPKRRIPQIQPQVQLLVVMIPFFQLKILHVQLVNKTHQYPLWRAQLNLSLQL